VDGMEFTWRMVGTLAWPIVVVVALIIYRKWIIARFEMTAADLPDT
jgi:hypothetical protein